MRQSSRLEPLAQQAEAFVIAGALREPLIDGEPVVVRSGAAVIEIHGVSPVDEIRLDGKPLAGAHSSSGTFTSAVDLTRATGFHRLAVAKDRSYVFGSSDAKLRIDGVVDMLTFLRDNADGPLGLKWDGVMQFSGSNTILRDGRLDLAWLEEHGDRIVELGSAIARRPFVSRRSELVRAPHGTPNLAATATLIRRRPELMENFERGQVVIDGERWSPREIVKRNKRDFIDTPGNRRATRLLTATLSLAQRCRAEGPGNPFLDRLENDLMSVLRRQPFREIRRRREHLRLSASPGVEERIDNRYASARQLLQSLLRDRHWDPTAQVADEWAYSSLADQVYQTFCAIVLAAAFDLDPSADLGSAGPHFANDEYELWVDSVPPSSVLQSWRASTSRPSELRPDLLLRRRSDGFVAMVDAKYRSDGDRATGDSLAEVQLYLQSFDCRQVSVLFPPTSTDPPWEINVVGDGHFAITELPLRPNSELDSYLSEKVRPAIERTFHAPSPREGSEAFELSQKEANADRVQGAAVRTLLADGAVVNLTQPGAMRASENSLRRTLADIWDDLPNEIQKMLITAEYFGDQVPEGFDHSGPVLGVFAACERLTRERLVDHLKTVDSQKFSRMTLGEIGTLLRRVPAGQGPRERIARSWLRSKGIDDLGPLASCGATIQKTNRWRIAAAHAELVDKSTWDKSYRAILEPEAGLLARLFLSLPSP